MRICSSCSSVTSDFDKGSRNCRPCQEARHEENKKFAERQLLRKTKALKMVGVYLVSDNAGHVKIGKFSGDIKHRLVGLQTGNAHKLTVVDCVYYEAHRALHVEKALHSSFRHLHVRGEWFKYDPNMKLVPAPE